MLTEFNDTVNEVLDGAIDMHVHAGPDANIERRLDMVETALLAEDLGMGGLVFKSHEYSTAPIIPYILDQVDELDCFGSIALDEEAGGLNPHALEICAKLDGKVVWMPTFTSDYGRSRQTPPRPGLKVIGDDKKLLPVMGDILEIIKQYDMVLATGHLWPEEIMTLTAESSRRGIKTICTHITFWMPLEDLKTLAARPHVYLEHCFLQVLPQGRRDPEQFFQVMREIGPGKSVLSTDLGQAHNPPPPEGFRMAIAHALRAGFKPDQVATMVRSNPRLLLGLD
ncbi:MAG TPA: DUF6282 family protein [Dehalococcoidia bacterium]|nr:DUF6282 family protein [Dehalococcoidia bacterium]